MLQSEAEELYQEIVHTNLVPGLRELRKEIGIELVARTYSDVGTNFDELKGLVAKALSGASEPDPEPAKRKKTGRPRTSEATVPVPAVERAPVFQPQPADCSTQIANVLASFNIPNLHANPVKPSQNVTFDMGDAGKMQCWYHWIAVTDNALILVYDTRFEFGSVFMPPMRGADHQLKVSVKPSNSEFKCYAQGSVFEFGCFTFVFLVIVNEDQPAEVEHGKNWRD